MDIFEAISKRHSVRQFHSNRPVDEKTVRDILEAGIKAPSAGNEQCWHFVVVRDPDLKHRLAVEAGHQPFIGDAPVTLVVCADLDCAEMNYGQRGRNTYALQDTAAAIENMLLATCALGLGACWIGAFDERAAAAILGLPKHLRPLAMLPIGVPAEAARRVPPRRSLEEVTTFR